MPIHETPNCVLCESASVTAVADVADYYRCGECDLHFVHPRLRLGREEEKARYDIHRNDVTDARYLDFLSPLFSAINERVARRGSGLDYGSGPAPALAKMFEHAGHAMAIYDPYYFPEDAVLKRTYDFISCSETAEHFYRPRVEFQLLRKILKPGGWLGVMTQLVDDQTDFKSWYYRRDPTHVVFYSLRTFKWLAGNFGFIKLKDIGPRVVLLQRPE